MKRSEGSVLQLARNMGKKVSETNKTIIVCLFSDKTTKGGPFLVFNMIFFAYIFSVFIYVFFLLNCASLQ